MAQDGTKMSQDRSRRLRRNAAEGSWRELVEKKRCFFSVYVAIWNARSAGFFRVMAAAAISEIFGGFFWLKVIIGSKSDPV